MTVEFDADDLDDDELDALAEMSDDDLAELYEDPGPDNPLAGYARPATRSPHEIDPYRAVDDLRPL
ncbi:hypothetical protein [Streptomyces indicus]|uniref:Uncharacterized protein n=1 Tax=Streptomyces indicus TaxID=417292 RepID=A0A1G9J8P8_9ACTN|nr:hypothetical protein [Streptomyces indicus]SDL33575.1 hypothetical protein SAMN05421806_12836 [Streptomyces indicus]